MNATMWKRAGAVLLALSCLAAVGCDEVAKKDDGADGNEDGKKDEGKDGDKEGDKGKMDVATKLGDADVKFTHAIVADRETSALWIHLGTKEMDCEKMNTGFVNPKDDEVGVAFQLSPQLQPDGKPAWKVTSANYAKGDAKGRKVDSKEAKVTKVDGNAKDGVTAEVDFAIEAKDGDTMTIKGTIVAKGCGSKPSSSKKAEAMPQKDVKASISGHAFDIQRAMLVEEKNGDWVIELASAPGGCDGYYSAGDFGINLKLDGDKKKVVHAWFRGDMLASNYNTNHEGVGSVEIGDEKDGKVPIKIEYQREAFDFKVDVKGDVTALKCKKE